MKHEFMISGSENHNTLYYCYTDEVSHKMTMRASVIPGH